jgi:hypothetical protein
MRVGIPEFATKNELFAYLKGNKATIVSQKKSMPIFSDCFVGKSTFVGETEEITTKENKPVIGDSSVLRVKVVANTANWLDSAMDLLLPDAANKSIKERKGIIPHLHDHVHRMEAKIGEVVDIIATTMSYDELGIKGKGIGSTQAIVFITDVMKSYNEQVFNQYKLGKVNQHSIGLQYIKIELAINDPESEKEFDFWNKYYDQIINKDVADAYGFFWVISEYTLIENSCVLFGANEITPTLDNNMKSEPTIDTPNEPLKGTQHFDVSKAVSEVSFKF